MVLVVDKDAAVVAVLQRELEVGEELLLLEAGHQVVLALGVRHDVQAISDNIVQHVRGSGSEI